MIAEAYEEAIMDIRTSSTPDPAAYARAIRFAGRRALGILYGLAAAR
jgi:hypothetical protein